MDIQLDKGTEKTFGEFVKKKRIALDKTLRGLAEELDIAPAYLCDIEKGNRYAPQKKLDDFIKALGLSGNELNRFYDLAGISRNNNFTDIAEYIGKSPLARVALRTARDNDLPDSYWQEVIDEINNRKKTVDNHGLE